MKKLAWLPLLITLWAPSSFAVYYNNAVCEPETNEFCLGLIRQGTGALNGCLRQNWDKLSAACQEKLGRQPQKQPNDHFTVAPINVAEPVHSATNDAH